MQVQLFQTVATWRERLESLVVAMVSLLQHGSFSVWLFVVEDPCQPFHR